ncbi:glutamine synthetase [Catalinimonas alkaloidigena]|uniref:Glutamine synthetase n=1 Tax=Catalinimonas alkaloidigena TaxID=1075417 RepID=A0A1G9PDV6_9BACT|nr:glutamine synthetase family protein [Catalinimonas alkaloidigena]SDL96397.1 glutamine synthetase [Catalinimonas alkaloidigena]
MTQDELQQRLQGFSRVKYAVADIDGVLRGKYIHRDKFLNGLAHGLGFCDVIFGWDVQDEVYDHVDLTGWHTGYPDRFARIDLSTFRQIPWEDDLPFFLADFDGQDTPACPRSLLKRMVHKAESMGYQPQFAQEFEWFNFRETSQSLEARGYHAPQPATTGMFGYSVLRLSQNSAFFKNLFELLDRFGVPLEGLHCETGPGVVEAAIRHTEALEAADRAVLLKNSVKEIAFRHGLLASFMAKWNKDLPGCSGHIHQSLWHNDENLFYAAEQPHKLSKLAAHYLAGQLHCLPDLLPLFAPTINSFKRLVEGAWAPTTVTWGVENRTNALRVINDTPQHMRIEHRVSGSDTNAYLAMAACLASGLYGIEQELPLTVPPTQGNGYQNKAHGTLAPNLWEATQRMKQSELARTLLGDAFVDHYATTRAWEWQQFQREVTDWELKRYFELI